MQTYALWSESNRRCLRIVAGLLRVTLHFTNTYGYEKSYRVIEIEIS